MTLDTWHVEEHLETEGSLYARQTFSLSDAEGLMMLRQGEPSAVVPYINREVASREAIGQAPQKITPELQSYPELDYQLDRARHLLKRPSRFKVERSIGEGSFGVIWSVKDDELQRSVALKTFKGEPEQAALACEDEVRLVGRLDHPAIPTIYDAGVTELGQPFVMMKLLEGESLSDIIKRLRAGEKAMHERYSFVRRVELMLQLLRALSKVHRSKILHRDIKPENILISPDGILFLLDWGCAIELEEAREKSTPCGTPLFMPPEQVRGGPLSPASDLFACAGVIYEFLCLSPPMNERGTLEEILPLIFTYSPPYVDQVYHSTQGYAPSEFSLIVMRGLHRDQKRRPQSAEEMIDTLQAALDGHIEIICPRTRIKHYIARFTRALDRNPYRVVPIMYSVLLSLTLLLVGLGIALGALIF